MISPQTQQMVHDFLTNFLVEKNGFSLAEEDQPRLALFEIESEIIPDVMGIIFAIRPTEDIDNPSEDTKMAALECLAALRELHPELSNIKITIDYTN